MKNRFSMIYNRIRGKNTMKTRMGKRCAALLLCAVLMVLTLGACTKETKTEGKLQIVASIFPAYDWTMQVVGENPADMDVRLLLDKGVDLHSYQPSVDDILLISNCDVFIYVGGESDAWVTDVLRQAVNKNMTVINLMELLGDKAKTEETVEGMQEHDHDHEDEEKEHDHEDEEKEYDEHVWLSLKNAVLFCDKICEVLSRADTAHAEDYRRHTEAYTQKLNTLHEDYQKAVNASRTKTLLFGDRFPFRYLTDDYGLTYYAAFAGCSAETEASFDTIVFLANKVDELGLTTILTTESTDGSVANTIKDNTKTKDQTILPLDSMQSVTAEQMKNGTTYLSVMQENLKVLRQALT